MPNSTATLEALTDRIIEEYPNGGTSTVTTTEGDTYIFAPGALYTIVPVNGYGYNVSKLLTEEPTRVGSVIETGADCIDEALVSRIESSLIL